MRAGARLASLAFAGAALMAGCSRARAHAEPLAPVDVFVGLEYSGQLPGTRTLVGLLLDEVDSTEYALEYVIREDGADTLLVLQEMLRRDVAGIPTWRVLASVRAPGVPAQHRLEFAVCQLRGAVERNVFALVKTRDTYRLDEVRAAWRTDPIRRTFEAVPVRDMSCANESFEP